MKNQKKNNKYCLKVGDSIGCSNHYIHYTGEDISFREIWNTKIKLDSQPDNNDSNRVKIFHVIITFHLNNSDKIYLDKGVMYYDSKKDSIRLIEHGSSCTDPTNPEYVSPQKGQTLFIGIGNRRNKKNKRFDSSWSTEFEHLRGDCTASYRAIFKLEPESCTN